MKIALKEAEKCLKNGDVPVGCVIVKNDKVIGKGYNKRKLSLYYADEFHKRRNGKTSRTLEHC